MEDIKLFELIQKEYSRQITGIELIASENFASEQVMAAMGSVLTNKYAEGLPGKRYYGGCQIVDQVENLAIERLCKLFGAEWANVQPHSGAQANAAVFLACLNPGDKILGFDLSHGGHLTHGSSVNFSGKLYSPLFYGVCRESGLIDYDSLESIAKAQKPKMIICGASAYSRDWDYKRIRAVADEIGALVLADISHPSGLIAKGLLNDPLEYCHIVTSTTHKTLRGPRGGIILWNNSEYTKKINSAIFPGSQGGPLMNIIAAKAQAFAEASTEEFKQYSKDVISNAQEMCAVFDQTGIKVQTDGTDSHLMLINLSDNQYSGREAADLLEANGITVNKNGIPNDPRSFVETSGIRIGTAAETTRGRDKQWFNDLANNISNILNN